ncbi:antitoxin VapB family protein [Halonotius sp. GCM10025705]|uniref:antitoxin VapB family protein n=1 Tax=Halonotius sp. GCM10025705 TaxID=3252678 RepID=UPI00362402FB
MGTKSVRLDEEVYERIAAHKRDDETFSEAIDRLTSDYSLLAFAGGSSAEAADRHRELLAEADAKVSEDRRERLQQLGVDTE